MERSIYIRAKTDTWVRCLPIIGEYYVAKLELIATSEIVEKFREFSPEIADKWSDPIIAAQELEKLKKEAAAILVGAKIGVPVGFLTSIAFGIKLGAAQGAKIDAIFMGRSLGAGIAAGSAIGSACGFGYWLWHKNKKI